MISTFSVRSVFSVVNPAVAVFGLYLRRWVKERRAGG